MFDTLYKENKCSKMKLTWVVLDKGPLICVSADTVNCFKKRLDKFWSNQEVLHNHKADLHGTRNRSILE